MPPAGARAVLILSLALGLSTPPALAASTWLCGLSEDLVRLVCLADATPQTDAPSAEDQAAAGASVRGVRFPLDPARQWTVDLWTPPSDLETVAQLARATICHRSPGCSIVMVPAVPQAQRWAPLRTARALR